MNSKVTIVPGTGLFKGSVLNPDTGKAFKFQGAINQSDNTGFGYFLNGGQSGSVTMEDTP